jgi:hypothetical protein
MEQEKATPRAKILALVGKFSVLMFLNITLGGGAFHSPWGILCGSVAYWVVHVIMVAFSFSSAWAAQVGLISVGAPVSHYTSLISFSFIESTDIPC